MSRPDQLELFPSAEGGREPGGARGQRRGLRLVHYLGSKLRFLDRICGAVESVAPEGARVCDLFAGSGSVSHVLSTRWDVTSVDIQEYSRVLCSAILAPPAPEALQGLDHPAMCEKVLLAPGRAELGAVGLGVVAGDDRETPDFPHLSVPPAASITPR